MYIYGFGWSLRWKHFENSYTYFLVGAYKHINSGGTNVFVWRSFLYICGPPVERGQQPPVIVVGAPAIRYIYEYSRRRRHRVVYFRGRKNMFAMILVDYPRLSGMRAFHIEPKLR